MPKVEACLSALMRPDTELCIAILGSIELQLASNVNVMKLLMLLTHGAKDCQIAALGCRQSGADKGSYQRQYGQTAARSICSKALCFPVMLASRSPLRIPCPGVWQVCKHGQSLVCEVLRHSYERQLCHIVLLQLISSFWCFPGTQVLSVVLAAIAREVVCLWFLDFSRSGQCKPLHILTQSRLDSGCHMCLADNKSPSIAMSARIVARQSSINMRQGTRALV